MSLRYIFPCPKCEHHFELVTKQAGQDLDCTECDTSFEAPKLGKMRQLETVGGETTKPIPASNKRLQNSLFVGGLAIAILAGGAGYFVYDYARKMIYEYFD